MLLFFKRRESLECTEVFFFSGVPFFSIAKSIVNFENYVTNREDLDRHIPQKINEFASLALPGRYP